MLNSGDLMKKVQVKKKTFNVLIGGRTHLTLFDFMHPVKESKHQNTDYVFFEGVVHTKDNKVIPAKKCLIQMPQKTCFYQLYHYLKLNKSLKKKNICLTIIKEDNYNYSFTIHPRVQDT